MKKFYFLILAMMVSLAVNATDYYLIGGFNGWSLLDSNAKFTDKGDGTFELIYSGVLTSGFKINDGTWSNDDANFGGDGTQLVPGTAYTMTVGGSSKDITIANSIKNPHLVFTPASATLLITGTEVEAQSKYAIHGQIFNGTDWTSVDMDKDENGKWTYVANIVPGEFGIKVVDAETNSQTNWYSCADESNTIGDAQLGIILNAKEGGSNWKSDITGEVTFTFDPEAMTLVIDKNKSGINNIEFDSNAPATYYNLQGIEVAQPNPGLYIQRQGNTVRKVIIR